MKTLNFEYLNIEYSNIHICQIFVRLTHSHQLFYNLNVKLDIEYEKSDGRYILTLLGKSSGGRES